MSDAKKFKQEEIDKKALKQLKDFQFILPKLVQADDLQSFKSDLECLETKLSFLTEKLAPLDSVFKKLDERLERESKKIKHLQVDSAKLEEFVEKKISHLNKNFQSLESKVDSLALSLDAIKENAHNQLEKSKDFVSKADLGTLHSKVTDLFNDLFSQKREIAKLSKEKENLQSQIKDREYDIKTILSSMEEQWLRMDQLYADLKNAVDKEQEVLPRMQKSIDFLVENVPKEIDSRIKDIKFPPEGMNEEKALSFIDQKFVPISLESKNTSLRSSNNEMKLNLLEKRLDHLSVNLKRLELEG